jgi:hypothetical protein
MKLATGWQNTEYRSYHFADPSDDNAYLVETQESWFSRHRETLRPSEEVQAELKRTYHREMESVWMPKGNEP